VSQKPDRLYVGPRDAVIAEVGAFPTPGKYLVQPFGELQYETEGCDTRADVAALVKEYRRQYPGITVVKDGPTGA
jgi:hypothetical protein